MPMRHLFIALLTAGILLTGPAEAQLRVVAPEVLATIVDDEPVTPRSMTAEERARWVLPDVSDRGLPPAGVLYTPAEYAPNEGLFLRWGSLNSVVTEITVAVTTQTEGAEVFLIVSGPAQESSAAATLASAGADLDRVQFLHMPSDSVWIRDYGPRTLFVGQDRALMDHSYNRPRPNDNQVPAGITALSGESLYELPLVHGGGNFHLFENRQAYMSDLILDENPGLSEQDVQDFYAEYHNLDLTILDPLPASFDSTQHLDMWFLPVDDHTVIIGQYDATEAGGIPYQVTEAAASLMTDRGYTVLRTPGWRSGAHYTYTNSVVINEAVLLCQFDGYRTENGQAADVFEQAFPDKVIVGVDCSNIITYSGAIHCIVMHYAERGTLLRDRFQAEVAPGG